METEFADEILVNFEGDSYPLNEIASISKKDPKKVIIDASAFPQVEMCLGSNFNQTSRFLCRGILVLGIERLTTLRLDPFLEKWPKAFFQILLNTGRSIRSDVHNSQWLRI